MQNKNGYAVHLCLSVFFISFLSCKNKTEVTNDLDLKRGEIVLCGQADNQFGRVSFETSCSPLVKDNFNLAMALLHSFEYDEAEKVFAKVIDADKNCAMAYWGVAMCNFHPLWSPPTQDELEKGTTAVSIAQSLTQKSRRETAYINAIAQFYTDWNTLDHHARCLNFENAMANMHADFPDDKEAAIFYALALDGAAGPTDKTYSKQRKAGDILNGLYPGQQDHPGIIHYIIHSYDSPELAEMALAAARKYALIAPSSAHALHMPSHIFTRLGLWDECIQSNLVSTDAAKCYAENSGMKGHFDEELHGLDYLVYAYLQKGDNVHALELCNYLKTIDTLHTINFKEAYAFAAIPSRYVLENKMWKDAAELKVFPEDFPWQKFPWQKAIIHFTRLLGHANTGNHDAAIKELNTLITLSDTLAHQKDNYKAGQVQIQIKAGEAWILFREGRNKEALSLMEDAAHMEESTQKSPVTPCEVIPATELLADMLLEMGKSKEALAAYESDLKEHPNRFNGLNGAARACAAINDKKKETEYNMKLIAISDPSSKRPELKTTGNGQ
ncbi:MAG: hypothetical protein ABJB16_06290 [Saprospiraceae bacterium]